MIWQKIARFVSRKLDMVTTRSLKIIRYTYARIEKKKRKEETKTQQKFFIVIQIFKRKPKSAKTRKDLPHNFPKTREEEEAKKAAEAKEPKSVRTIGESK